MNQPQPEKTHVFLIRPIADGYELECEGIMRKPLRTTRLIEAVIAASQIGQGLDAEVQILNTDRKLIETLKMEARNPKTL